MKPNIEKEIREKFDSRTIQPSAQAWDRLDAMLTVAEDKKAKRSFGWLYMAASFLVFLSIGMYFYTQEKAVHTTNPTLVGIENNTDSVKENPATIAETPNSASETATSDTINNSPNKSNADKPMLAQTQKHLTPRAAERNTANQNQKTNNNPTQQKATDYQISEDVAVKKPKSETPNEAVVQRTVNSNPELLASVERPPTKSESTSKVKVNANNLLSEVDGELNLTFREKVFKKAKEVKVALANRNNL